MATYTVNRIRSFVWEFTSIFFILILIPAILYLDHRYPIATSKWKRRLLLHIPASMIFSLIHVTGMVYFRKILYFLMGHHYDFGNLPLELLYEYRKDVMTYTTILFIIYGYREIMRLRSGEAQLIHNTKKTTQDDRILVSKSGVYFFLTPRSIDWIEAAGNYVEIHVNSNSHMYRGTMKQLLTRLPQPDFIRVHRSYIVNQDRIQKVQPAANGDQWLTLTTGKKLRLSRRYRHNLANGAPKHPD
ncbi:MAG: DNA-binding protein [Alphaproteobacteria bacterium]|nr:MAG: DNA-binding protein [Alphaproteobacteria bacterium]